MNRFRAAVFIAALTLVVACKSDGPTSPESSPDVVGSIFDYDTHDPIAGAEVIHNLVDTTYTDAAGHFRFPNAGFGTHRIVVHGLGLEQLDMGGTSQDMGGIGIRRYAREIAYYPFDGNLRDSTASHHDGSASSASFANDRFALSGHALMIGGGTKPVKVSNVSDLNFGSQKDFTIAFWIKIPPTTQADSTSVLNKMEGIGPDRLGYQVALIADYRGYYHVQSIIGTSKSLAQYDGAQLDVTNKWQLVMLVYDRQDNRVYFYQNSDQSWNDRLKTIDGNMDNPLDLMIGGTSPVGTASVDDLRIFQGKCGPKDFDILYHERGF